MYISYRKIDSYNLPIRVIVGARGIGKTFGAKRKCIKSFLYNEKKFIWLRDNEDAIEKLSDNKGEKFFEDISKYFPKCTFEITGDRAIFINEKHAGYLMNISTFYNYKGNAYNDIKTIVFDEFIPEKGQKKMAYRMRRFLNTIETIGRLRKDYVIYMTANALDINDEFFSLVNIRINNFGYYVNKNKGVVVWYAENNPVYNYEHSNSIIGKLISGSVYEDNIMNNKFSYDNDLYFDKKPPKSIFHCVLYDTENNSVRVYMQNGLLYIDEDANKNQYINRRFVRNVIDVNTTTKKITKYMLDTLREYASNSKVRYKNGTCYNIFNSFLQ